jgi:GT2 family glycosyltransferase
VKPVDVEAAADPAPQVARHPIVVIGRNEAERLPTTLAAAFAASDRVIYVDSDSTDGSAGIARCAGAEVVQLYAPPALSAARSRNAGAQRAAELWPETEFLQFLDGDCELVPSWVARAASVLRSAPDVAIVCGRLRERRRAISVFARLLDMEFDREPGDVASCGGIFMARAAVFRDVGGFDPSVAAGEEPELCLRIRRRGYRVVRLADDMACHEGGIDGFAAWWRRAVRSGRAYAHAAELHGSDPERPGVRESASIWFWAAALPVVALALALPSGGWSLLLALLYPAQVARTAWRRRRPGESAGDRVLFAVACMAAKFPQLQGQVGHRLRRRSDAAAPQSRAASPQEFA